MTAPALVPGGGGPSETFILNLGPQHPATHGVLRVKLTMDGEYIRVITSELNRISSHLVWFGAFLLDLGGFTPLLYAFDDREKILDLLEAITGARLTYCYYRFGGVCNDIDDDFIRGTRAFVAHMRPRLGMYRQLVTDNIILRKRLEGIGPIRAELCRKYGATGPVIRGSGVAYDVRRVEPYSVYPEFDFAIPTHPEGDCMARYLVRMEEMGQSLRIVEQALDRLPDGPVQAAKLPRVLRLPAGDYCYAVEAARGRFAVRVISDHKEIPYRVKLRTPSFSNLSLYEEASQGLMLPDAIAVMGSLDLVIPDIDR